MKYVLLVIAILAGLGIAYVDSRPTWDDTGITAFSIFGACAIFSFLSPRSPWLWALAVGAWVPLAAILLNHNYGGLLALLFAFAGAYAGMLLRRLVEPAHA